MMVKYKAKRQALPGHRSPYYHPASEPAIKMGSEVLSIAVMTVTPPSHS
jgi:hypothetical protein